jgi:putative oxidoreductase
MDRVRDLVALVARIGLGVILTMHGWQKFFDWGLAGTEASFVMTGVPLPGVSALFASAVELFGGAALILGIGLPIVGILIAIDMAGAFLFAHSGFGLIEPGGGELVIGLGVGSLIAGFHGGAYSLDRVLSRARGKHELVTA